LTTSAFTQVTYHFLVPRVLRQFYFRSKTLAPCSDRRGHRLALAWALVLLTTLGSRLITVVEVIAGKREAKGLSGRAGRIIVGLWGTCALSYRQCKRAIFGACG
jgi:hypothetical protein